MKLIKRDGERHFIFITGKIHQDEVPILNIYVPNAKASKYVKEILLQLKLHIKPHTLEVVDFSTPLLPMDMSSRQKINKETMKLTCSDTNGLNRHV